MTPIRLVYIGLALAGGALVHISLIASVGLLVACAGAVWLEIKGASK